MSETDLTTDRPLQSDKYYIKSEKTMSFAEPFIEQCSSLSNDDIRDAFLDAEVGIICVDDDGVISFYNNHEAQFSGVTEEKAVGENFFTHIAPCTNNRIFAGRFRDGVAQEELDRQFTYTFTYRMRPTNVSVHLYRDSSQRNWIFIKKA